jgi:protein-disulfide isomerase
MIRSSPFFLYSRRLAVCAAAILLTTLGNAWASETGAQGAAGEEHAAITNDQANAILEELKGIRKLLESIDKKGVAQAPARPPVPPTAKVSIKGSASLGSVDAPVTVVEFTDYQCTYCLKFIQNTFPKLKEQFIDTGKVRWVIRDMPLGFHKNARKAAQAAHCAGEQDKFWEMRGVLFANAKKLEAENLPSYAQIIGLDGAAFDSCLASDRYLAAIDDSSKDAGTAQITGTPTFVVGKAASDSVWGDSVEGDRVVGARDFKVFEERILKALGERQAAAK